MTKLSTVSETTCFLPTPNWAKRHTEAYWRFHTPPSPAQPCDLVWREVLPGVGMWVHPETPKNEGVWS